jgi:type VI secretion system protein ImpC
MSPNDTGAAQEEANALVVLDDLDVDAILSQVADPLIEDFDDDLKDRARLGVAWLMRALREEDRLGISKIDGRLIDALVEEIDAQLSDQVNAILHHKDFRSMESAWRSVQFLVDRTDFRQNISLSLLNVTKAELADDLTSEADASRTKLYGHLYSPNLGTYGGTPFGAVIGNYEFDTRSADVALLKSAAAVAAMAHAPFIAAASSKAFGASSFKSLVQRTEDIGELMKGDQFTKWHALRESEDARYLGLALPRFVLRLPYGPDSPAQVRSFKFLEPAAADDEDYLWGNAAFAFASRLTGSFAQSGWCANIIGPKAGGRVADLPVHVYQDDGHEVAKPPVEVLLTGLRDFQLAEAGFIPLVMHKDRDDAVFFSAQSVQKPKFFGISKEGKEAEFNYRLSTQLPYMFIISRLAHYVKVIQTQEIGTSLDRQGLQTKLQTWLAQYVSASNNPAPDILRQRPLRAANIDVLDVEGEPGWYRVNISVTPHYKYQGAHFTLSLAGRLEKKK